MAKFYDPEGLKLIGRLILAERQNRKVKRNPFAEEVGLTATTVKNLEEAKIETPEPSSILTIAPFITNPETGKPFDPEEFLLVARGRKEIQQKSSFFDGGKSPILDSIHTNHRILMSEDEAKKFNIAGYISRLMIEAGYTDIAEYGTSLGLDGPQFLSIMKGERIPSIDELGIIAERIPLPSPLPREALVKMWATLWDVKAEDIEVCAECKDQTIEHHKTKNGAPH